MIMMVTAAMMDPTIRSMTAHSHACTNCTAFSTPPVLTQNE